MYHADMNKINVSAPHALGQAGAKERLKTFLDKAEAQLSKGPIQAPNMPLMSGSLKQEWKDYVCEFDFEAQGQSLSGSIEIEADKVSVTAKIPLAAVMLKGKLQSALADGLKEMLK